MASKRAVVAKIELLDQVITGLQDLRRFEMEELEQIEMRVPKECMNDAMRNRKG